MSKAPDRKVRSSSQSITSSVKVRSVRPHLLDERASTSDDSAHGGGPRSWAGPSRRRHAGERRTHRCMAAETVPPTSDHSDEMAGRVDRRVRNSGSPWRGDQPNVKRGSGPRCPLLSGGPLATSQPAPPRGRDPPRSRSCHAASGHSIRWPPISANRLISASSRLVETLV